MTKTKPTLEMVCELFGVKVTAAKARTFERHLKRAAQIAYPNEEIRACWVHEGIKK